MLDTRSTARVSLDSKHDKLVTVEPSDDGLVDFTISNTTDEMFQPSGHAIGGVNLGIILKYSATAGMCDFAQVFFLTAPLHPGQTVKFTAALPAALFDQNAEAQFAFDLVAEGVGWFEADVSIRPVRTASKKHIEPLKVLATAEAAPKEIVRGELEKEIALENETPKLLPLPIPLVEKEEALP